MQRKNIVKLIHYGRLGYLQGLNLQNLIINKHKKNENEDTVIFLEHNPVYTVGLRDKTYSKDEQELKKLGAEFFRTNRGGLITFHGPGQLVLYPIINLKHFKPSLKWYVDSLEKTIIDVCKYFSIKAQKTNDTGIWVQDRKICSIGIHGSRYIVSHGLSLNCNIDLNWFTHIVPCGLEDKEMTSLSKELGRNVCIDEVIPVVINSFSKIFNCNFCNYSKEEMDKIKTLVNINF